MQAGTNIVCVEYDDKFINKEGLIEPKFKVLFREEIPRSEFTYTEAVDRIIQLNDIYNPQWIAIDRGYGDVQIEMLKKYGISNPTTGLNEKILPYQFAEKIPVRDPHTQINELKPMKPFMVNNSVLVFEKQKIVFHPNDKQMLQQFEGYIVESVSKSGLPIFSSKDEHIVDATNLCLLAFEQKLGSLMKQVLRSTPTILSPLAFKDEYKLERQVELNSSKDTFNLGGKKYKTIDLSAGRTKPKKKNKFNSISREIF